MKPNVVGLFVLTGAIALTLAVSARAGQNANQPVAKPVKLLGGILVPGNPLRWDIAWVDQTAARLYLGEAGSRSLLLAPLTAS